MTKDKMIQAARERLKAWEEELKTNKYNMAHKAEGHIEALKEQIIRLEHEDSY